MEPDTAEDKQERLEYWISHLTNREMPVFAHTARVIAGEASRSESSASELAKLILQDVSMTTRLLRIANSIHYNPGRNTINTVSRSIVVLGFEAVRNICLSIAIIDSLLEGEHKTQVLKEMARAFHAAVQARTLAAERNDKSPEEVFIAALLFHLGHMAFWCFADSIDKDAAARLQKLLGNSGNATAQDERKALGFTLAELTGELNREWHLSPLLDSALQGRQADDPRTTNITLAHELASHAEQGWDSPQMKQLLERAAESLYIPLDKTTKLIHANAREAALTMAKLGAGAAGKLIPVPAALANTIPERELVSEIRESKQFLDPDPDLQLKILRELSQLLTDEKPNPNLLFEMILEGIYRGIGMDRALFALMSPDRKTLLSKYTLGWDRRQLNEQFHFKLTVSAQTVIDHVIQTHQPLWVPREPDPEIAQLLTPAIRQISGGAPFFLMPITVQGKVIGMFYADRKPSRRELDEEAFSSFKLFGQQSRLGLSML